MPKRKAKIGSLTHLYASYRFRVSRYKRYRSTVTYNEMIVYWDLYRNKGGRGKQLH